MGLEPTFPCFLGRYLIHLDDDNLISSAAFWAGDRGSSSIDSEYISRFFVDLEFISKKLLLITNFACSSWVSRSIVCNHSIRIAYWTCDTEINENVSNKYNRSRAVRLYRFFTMLSGQKTSLFKKILPPIATWQNVNHQTETPWIKGSRLAKLLELQVKIFDKVRG